MDTGNIRPCWNLGWLLDGGRVLVHSHDTCRGTNTLDEIHINYFARSIECQI